MTTDKLKLLTLLKQYKNENILEQWADPLIDELITHSEADIERIESTLETAMLELRQFASDLEAMMGA